MKQLCIILCALINLNAFAASDFILTRSADGSKFYCNSDSTNPNDPNSLFKCVSEITEYCYQQTSFGRQTCTEKASLACKSKGVTFDCVSKFTEYYYKNTSSGRQESYERAITTCSGNTEAILSSLEMVKHSALLEGAGLKINRIKEK